MSKASLIVGNSNWAIKDSSLLGYNINDSNIYSPFPFDVTRASAATTVNKAGLIVTDEEILSGELVTNGSFATDSDWIKSSQSTISNGSANILSTDGSFQFLKQDGYSSSQGKQIKVTLDVVNIQSGELKVSFAGGSNFAKIPNVIGTHNVYIVNDGSIGQLWISREAGITDVTIDNVSVVEVNRNNLARIDYLDSTKGVLLTEPQSTNLITESDDFSASYWFKSDATITSKQIVSPSGVVNADKITDNTNNVRHGLFVIGSWASGVESVFSIFVKKGNSSKLVLGSTSNAQGSFFNLDTEVIVNTGSFVGSMVSFGNGWYRCSTVFTAPSNYNLFVGLYNTVGSFDYVGIGSNLYIWGAQLENLPYATSIIPTSGSTVTRNQDQVTNGGEVSTFNSEEGVLFLEGSFLQNGRISLKNSNELYQVVIGFSSSIFYRIKENGTNIITNFFTSTDLNTDYKIAVKYGSGNSAIYVNGVKKSDLDSYNLIDLSKLEFVSEGQEFFGKTSQVQVFKKALTDAELIKLTTI